MKFGTLFGGRAVKNIGIILILSAWVFTIIVLVIRNADDNKTAEQQRKESEAIWVVSGPFQGTGGPQSSNLPMFLLDHPVFGRRLVGKNAFVGCASPNWKVPRAVVEQGQGERTISYAVSYREILVDLPASQ